MKVQELHCETAFCTKLLRLKFCGGFQISKVLPVRDESFFLM